MKKKELQEGFKMALFVLILSYIAVIFLIVCFVSCAPKHTPRYDKYDKDGLLKSSTPLYLDKNKGRKTKNRVK